MKALLVNDELYQAEKIVKKESSIIGYNGESEVFAFRGINNFNKFELEEGQEFDVDEKTALEKELVDLWDVVLFGGVE